LSLAENTHSFAAPRDSSVFCSQSLVTNNRKRVVQSSFGCATSIHLLRCAISLWLIADGL